MWLSGLGIVLQTEMSLVQFLIRTHSCVVGQFPSWGLTRATDQSMFLSLSLSHLLSLKINKIFKNKGCKVKSEKKKWSNMSCSCPRKNPDWKDVNQINLLIQCNLSKNPNRIILCIRQTNSKSDIQKETKQC